MNKYLIVFRDYYVDACIAETVPLPRKENGSINWDDVRWGEHYETEVVDGYIEAKSAQQAIRIHAENTKLNPIMLKAYQIVAEENYIE